MRYWHVYYCSTDKRYKLTNTPDCNELARFKSFDMAYDYIGRMNNTNMTAYTRGTR